MPNKLILRGQIVLKETAVLFEPFHPKPASPSILNSSLRLSLEDANESGLIELPGPTIGSFRFWVSNYGNQTIRDYRVMILVPPPFRKPPYGSYEGNLFKHHDLMMGERRYAVYEKSISQPIYKNDSIKIGEILLSTDLGDHVLLWQIRCDEGVFPTETTYGEIKVRIVPLGNLVERADENLFKKH